MVLHTRTKTIFLLYLYYIIIILLTFHRNVKNFPILTTFRHDNATGTFPRLGKPMHAFRQSFREVYLELSCLIYIVFEPSKVFHSARKLYSGNVIMFSAIIWRNHEALI